MASDASSVEVVAQRFYLFRNVARSWSHECTKDTSTSNLASISRQLLQEETIIAENQDGGGMTSLQWLTE